MTNAEIAAAIIGKARDLFGQGPAAFDYHMAAGSIPAIREYQNAAYLIANEGHENDDADTKSGRLWELLATVKPDMDAYRERCKERSYVGWSTASGGPIRYADR